MKNKGTILLGFIAVGLLVYIALDLWEAPSTTELEQEARRLSRVEWKNVQRIELTSPQGQFVFVRQEETREGIGDEPWVIDQWNMIEPIQFPANRQTVRDALVEADLARRLDTLAKNGEVEPLLKQYGLQEPRFRITLKTEESSETITLGQPTALGDSIYALVNSGKRAEIVVAPKTVEEAFNHSLEEWRSHEVFDFHPPLITKILLRRPQGEVVVEKNIESNEWNISKPLVTPADANAVQQYLNQISNLQSKRFVSEKNSAPATYGFDVPSMILEISDFKKTHVLKTGSADPEHPEEVFAMLDNQQAVFTIPKRVLETAGNLLDTVRNRKIVSYPYTAAVKELKIQNGDLTYRLSRDMSEKAVWRFTDTGKKADFFKVDRFLGELYAAKAESFSADPAKFHSSQSQPAASVEWSAEATEESTSAQWNETITFHTAQDTENTSVLVQTPSQPSAVTVSKDVLSHFPKNRWDWFTLQIFDTDEKITGIRWKAEGKELAVTRGLNEESTWQLTQDSSEQGELDAKILELQTKVLNDLKAEKWGGKITNSPETALLTLEIKRGETVDILRLFKQGNTVITQINEDAYGFALSKRDMTTLFLSPVKKQDSALNPRTGAPAP